MDDEALAIAREETHAMLAALEHYSAICRAHLEFGDDPCALMALADARRYFLRALAAFQPVRDAMRPTPEMRMAAE